jgi:hypothetical protein
VLIVNCCPILAGCFIGKRGDKTQCLWNRGAKVHKLTMPKYSSGVYSLSGYTIIFFLFLKAGLDTGELIGYLHVIMGLLKQSSTCKPLICFARQPVETLIALLFLCFAVPHDAISVCSLLFSSRSVLIVCDTIETGNGKDSLFYT